MKTRVSRPTGGFLLAACALGVSLLAPARVCAAQAEEDFIRPRQEGTFKARIGATKLTKANVLGHMHGHEIAEVAAPTNMLSMGKAVAVDPSGNLWFVDSREDKAVRLNPRTMEITDFGMPRGAAPYSLAIDPQGTVWMTAHGIEMLLELHPKEGVVISHAPPTHGFLIHIQVDPKNNTVYFGQPGANKVVAYHPQTGFREYTIPTENSGPGRIDIAADGTVWFTELYANRIAHLTPSTGKIEEWELPIKNALPVYCRVAKDGTIWISEPMADRIELFRDGEIIKTYKIPTINSIVSTQVEDNDGIVWFTEGGWRGSSGGNKLGRLDPATGAIEEFKLPTENAQPLGLVMDHDGAMWFEESTLGKLIRVRKYEVAQVSSAK
jgi:virginiamycin B lyase